jgi:hypothetical protein
MSQKNAKLHIIKMTLNSKNKYFTVRRSLLKNKTKRKIS